MGTDLQDNQNKLTEHSGKYYTYILRCVDRTLYTGWTTDLKKRLRVHNSGKGAKYTRCRLPVVMVYFEEFSTKHDAMSREVHIKQMNKVEKENLIRDFVVPEEYI